MGKEEDWRERAKEIYRVARSELLQSWSGPQQGDAAFYKEELEEALLDLKQALIDDRADDATAYRNEVLFDLAELRLRRKDY
jgi:hypothetical protein